MRWMPLLALLCLLTAGDARAAMMAHYDLAGLALESDAIVVATRTPAADRTSTYHVTRAIRGPIAAGTDLVLDDGLYATEGHAIDPEVVVFLHRADAGGWYITSSGLRVVDGGQVFRFEQWDNPGGFTMVPQGHDPSDQWRAHPGRSPDSESAKIWALRRANQVLTNSLPNRTLPQLKAL